MKKCPEKWPDHKVKRGGPGRKTHAMGLRLDGGTSLWKKIASALPPQKMMDRNVVKLKFQILKEKF